MTLILVKLLLALFQLTWNIELDRVNFSNIFTLMYSILLIIGLLSRDYSGCEFGKRAKALSTVPSNDERTPTLSLLHL